ncbi:ubiquitin-like domain-containing protein CIP73 isoform X2 [Amaranthus tricolor]|uniref:ubiquitin-like domain-containing protein CIP73 isoform X2 n=1 Tax=Amaranthus tricolor TaxID=29722 RepID=UPI00258E5559|nr:ubiquitin-like domain-containing protein CIP73 isoform X2 [Amaranthus tricolor]
MAHNANDVSMHAETESSATTIEIKIKTMDSQTYSLQVDKQMPVPALKERIASVTGVVTEHQRLICRGKVLKDDQLLSAYRILSYFVQFRYCNYLSAVDPLAGNRGQYYQLAPGIVVETFNMPGQGDRVLPDVNRIISAVLGSIGLANPGSGNEGISIGDHVSDRPGESTAMDLSTNATHTQPEQSGLTISSDRSRLPNTFGISTGFSVGSLQAPVVPDALATLSQYLSHMRQEFIESARPSGTDSGASLQGNEGGSSSVAQSVSAQEGLPSPASLAGLLSATREMLNQQVEECLLQLERQLQNQENMTDPAVRVTAQSGALRSGILLQNLGAYFLEIGRTVTTLRLGRSPSEAVVNAGPAVFISSSGPNPLMVQPLPFQPGASFSTPISGATQSSSGMMNAIGGGFVPRRIDIQIRRVGSSTLQTEPFGSRQSTGQSDRTTNVSGEALSNQSSTGISTAPSSNNGPAVRILPFRTMMASVPDLNRSPQHTSDGSGLVYPYFGTGMAYVSSRAGNQPSDVRNSSGSLNLLHNSTISAGPAGNGRAQVSSPGQRESITSRTIDINFLSNGGSENDQNSDGQIPPVILQSLRSLFPGSEFQVESVSSQGAATGSVMEQERSSDVAGHEAEPMPTEEGLFLSRILQQIMPLISENSGADASLLGDGPTSTPAEDNEVGTSRQNDDANLGPNPKRQKKE